MVTIKDLIEKLQTFPLDMELYRDEPPEVFVVDVDSQESTIHYELNEINRIYKEEIFLEVCSTLKLVISKGNRRAPWEIGTREWMLERKHNTMHMLRRLKDFQTSVAAFYATSLPKRKALFIG